MKSTRQPAQPGGHSVDAAAGFGRRSAGTNGGAGCPDSLAALARQAERVLRSVYRCPGMNLGMNLGECAGAGVAGHIHLHVVPRWAGRCEFHDDDCRDARAARGALDDPGAGAGGVGELSDLYRMLYNAGVADYHLDQLHRAQKGQVQGSSQVMPMDVPDEGYRLAGNCDRLRGLIL